MSQSEVPNESVGTRARRCFFFPAEEAVFFRKLDEAILGLSPAYCPIAKAFRRNLEAVVLTVSVPYQLTLAGVHQLRFQQIYAAERIRSLTYVDKGESQYEADKKALAKAREKFSGELHDPEMIDKFALEVLSDLDQSLKRGEFARAASELLRQGDVLAWGALEVLAQDIFITLLNANPALASELLNNESTKRLFQLKAMPLEILLSYNFNLSEKLGEILIRYRAIDSIPVIKAVFGALFPGKEDFRQAMDNRKLWLLNQRRHLIVHRRGVVDSDYIANTGEAIEVGAELDITPNDIEEYLTAVMNAGVELLGNANER